MTGIGGESLQLTGQLSDAVLTDSALVFRTMADSAPVLMWAGGPSKLCTFLNEKWLSFRGRSFEQECGDGWTEGVHPDDLSLCMEIYSEHFERREPFEIEYRLLRHDGEYRWILDRGAPHMIRGEFAGYIGACVDVTDRRQDGEVKKNELERLNRELLELNADLEMRVQQRTAALVAKNEELDAFTYSVAHDLRAPIRGIVGNIRVAIEDAQGSIDDEIISVLNKAHAAALNLGALVDDLLHFSRTGTRELQLVRFNLSDLFLGEFEQASQEFGGPEVDLNIQADVFVIADPSLMSLAIRNLIDNSLKYRRRTGKPRIEFGRTRDDTRDLYWVRDDGIGFDMAFVHRLFKPFERLHRQEEYPGTGIGLANVRRVIERHGGTIWADSHLGKGTTFYFTLA